MKKKSEMPEWALQYRTKGTELRLINRRYYLYEYKTVYDTIRKKPKKISGALIGSITEQGGLKPSSKRLLREAAALSSVNISDGIICKEYGAAQLVTTIFSTYAEALKLHFAEDWKNILAIAYCRFVYQCPLKAMPFRLATSYLPKLLDMTNFSDKQASTVLKRIGGQPQLRQSYMKSFIKTDDYILIDATGISSQSNDISLARRGYSHPVNFDTQFNLLYIYSSNSKMPVYYKLLAGNIREVKAFKNCLLEAGLSQAVIIADKGFYSKDNQAMLISQGLQFIIPLRRNNALIDYSDIKTNTLKTKGLYLEHEKRFVWYQEQQPENGVSLFLFLDEGLRVKEESDYLSRIKTLPESFSIQNYHIKKDHFGTIALMTNLSCTAEQAYQTYKSRMAIEVLFDGMKNVLNADHTYMQDEQTLQGWIFVNHITLQWYQHLYLQLKEKDLIKSISVNDYIQLLTDVKKILINDTWHFSEFTNYTQKLIKKLGMEIV